MSQPEPPPDREGAYRERVFAERARLAAALADVPAAQDAVLADLLAANADTAFGREHDLAAVRTLDDFRKAVPIRDYSGLAPWIERAAAGEHGVLTEEDPVLYFTSSGSTGAHKKVPVTARFMRTSFFPFYFAAWAPLAERHPRTTGLPDRMLNLKHDPRPAVARTASGREHLGASQVDLGARFGEPQSAEPGTWAPWATLPGPVANDDHLEKTYLRLRAAVAGDVRGLIGINPAMVAAVPYQLRLWWPRLVQEIADGTADTPADPGRARELEALAARYDPLLPAHVWPDVEAIFCWTTGLASLYLPRLREEFGIGVSVLPAPVAASEGPVAVPLDRHGSAGSPVVTAAAYEFVDADEELRPDSATLGLADLTAGRDYQVVFSHVGGLYRYAVGDVVRVADTTGGVPRLAYAGRADTSDVAGERLRESQVVRALATALEAGGMEVRNAGCRPVSTTDGHAYEVAVATRGPWTAAETGAFADRLDAALTAGSAGYRDARTAGRLGAAQVRALDGEAFLRDWHERVAAGARPAQVKDRVFWRDPAAWTRLVGDGSGS
ncbi:MAG TPA: GH3 auxin-responsive promoter family protein [Mycobacteriales bacterium]|nr:GH3 auxin-responsive promoter family protein [Mycobacteriales bacterium]